MPDSRHRLNQAAAIVLVLACASPAQSQGDPWQAMRDLPAGTQLAITTKSRADVRGRLELVTEQELVLAKESASQLRIPRAEIQTIRMLTADSVWNGVLVGAVLGSAGGSAVGAAWLHGSGRYGAKPPGYAREFITGVGVLGGLAGALAGWRMDARRSRSLVIYDVRGFQIAVNDPLLVRGFDRFRDLLRDREGFVEWDRAAREASRQASPSTSAITRAETPALSSSP